MIGYSPKFPLQFDNEVGAYSLNTTLGAVAKQNFKNLLLTSKGERIMDMDFGVGLRRFLFEPIEAGTRALIARAIEDQVEKYLSYITISEVSFATSESEGSTISHLLSVQVKFSVPTLGMEDNLVIDDDTRIGI